MQPGPDIAGRRDFAAHAGAHAARSLVAAAQVVLPHAFRGMLHLMQLRALNWSARRCGVPLTFRTADPYRIFIERTGSSAREIPEVHS
jgi:hypothetical protein